MLIETKRGTFEVPFANLRSLSFTGGDINKTEINSDEQISLKNSLGRLSFELKSIKGGILQGSHPILGKFLQSLFMKLKDFKAIFCKNHTMNIWKN